MAFILGIETSCDETAAAVYDSTCKSLLSSNLFSQIKLHEKYGGVVPEIASRSHLNKINIIVQQSLDNANIDLKDIDVVAVTNKPGLIGSLLIGLSFAKGLAWAQNKKLIGIDHLEGHIFSSFLQSDGSVRNDIFFPHICLIASGGHTSFYLVKGFGSYQLLGQTLDDAAGEAFDKVAKLIDLGYPGGPQIEKLASSVNFEDFLHYPRTKDKNKSLNFSFSGLKTAVLYDLVKKGAFDLNVGIIKNNLTSDLQNKVASSLLVCIADIIQAKVKLALKLYPEVTGVSFVGGVACNKFLREKLSNFCKSCNKQFIAPLPQYCGDNAAMIAFVGAYKAERFEFSDLDLDVLK